MTNTGRLTKREGKHTVRIGNEWRRHDLVWDKLAEYEDLGTVEELKEAKRFKQYFDELYGEGLEVAIGIKIEI